MSSILGSQVSAAAVRVGRGLFPLLLVLALAGLAAISPASAVCQSSGKSCGLNAVTNDRLCCPGTVCGWGKVCQAACRINGVLYQSGAKNPANDCQACRPALSTTRWSNVSAGTACGSSIRGECDRPDTCNGAGSCQSNFEPATKACGSPSDTECDNPDRCSGTSAACLAQHEPANTNCGDSEAACVNQDKCDGAGVCTDNGFKPDTTPCSDDNACTNLDTCSNGSCASGPPLACDDANDCTDDSCNSSVGCVNAPNSACGICGTTSVVCPGGPGPTCIELRLNNPPVATNTPTFTDGATVQTWPTPGVPGCLPDVTPNWPGALVAVDSTAPVAPPIQTCYNDSVLWVSSGRDVGAMAGKKWLNDLENLAFDAPAGKLFTSVGIVLECDLPAERLHDVQVYYYIAPGQLCEQQLIEPPLYAAKPSGGCNSYILDTIPSDVLCAAGFRRIEIEPQIGSACRIVSTNSFRTASVP